MENVAHALAGLLVARGAVALRARRERVEPSARFGVLAGWTSALANNVPDGDLVMTPLTGGKLGYLLHHRGHTHTLPIGIVLGVLVAVVVLAVARRRSGEVDADDRRWILGLGALGPVVHVAMDGWNVYGVHPFWPVYNGWIYGDAVFIVEPLLWLAAAPFLFLETRSPGWRGALAFITLLGIGLPWLLPGFVPLGARIAILVFFSTAVLAATRTSLRWRIPVALALFFSVPSLFLLSSAAGRAGISARAREEFPGEKLADAAMTSWPSNPLCWSGVLVSTTQAGDFVLRRVTFALAPDLVPVSACPVRETRATAPLVPVGAPDDNAVRWDGEHRVDLERLRKLARDRCDVAAAMRFVRAPFLVDGDASFVLGDLRFDRDERLDFAELELPAEPGRCPRFVPSWDPPRGDILAP